MDVFAYNVPLELLDKDITPPLSARFLYYETNLKINLKIDRGSHPRAALLVTELLANHDMFPRSIDFVDKITPEDKLLVQSNENSRKIMFIREPRTTHDLREMMFDGGEFLKETPLYFPSITIVKEGHTYPIKDEFDRTGSTGYHKSEGSILFLGDYLGSSAKKRTINRYPLLDWEKILKPR